ncbi:MAG: transposase [Spiroplasma sp.]
MPRDRNSTFEPAIIPKRQRRFDNFDQKVISLAQAVTLGHKKEDIDFLFLITEYARGMTISDIKMQLQELYHGAEISESLISQITDNGLDEAKI